MQKIFITHADYLTIKILLSATPGPYELEVSKQVVEQIVRPTGLVDPEVVVKQQRIKWMTWLESSLG